MDGDDSYSAAGERIADTEWERTAKPGRGGPGGAPPGKAGEVPVAKWAPLFGRGGSLFSGGGPGGFPPRGDRCPRRP